LRFSFVITEAESPPGEVAQAEREEESVRVNRPGSPAGAGDDDLRTARELHRSIFAVVYFLALARKKMRKGILSQNHNGAEKTVVVNYLVA
jgi:hypothetical protein